MLSIFAEWTEEKEKIISSLSFDGKNAVLSLRDDGFLPKRVGSPYGILAGIGIENAGDGEPLFANLLKVPPYWEIVMWFTSAQIRELDHKRGQIIYADQPGYSVHKVQWEMPDGTNYRTDYYDRFGTLFYTEFMTAEQQVAERVVYDRQGRVVLTEHPSFGTFFLYRDGEVCEQFHSVKDLLLCVIPDIFEYESAAVDEIAFLQFARELGFQNIYYVVDREEQIPEELRTIPSDSGVRVLYFADSGYDNWARTLNIPCERRLRVEKEFPESSHGNEALILTDSERVEAIDVLIDALPEMHFHIAARTMMSDKLTVFNGKRNVTLHPGIDSAGCKKLIKKCSYYFDINHFREIFDGVYEAYRNNLLIIGFDSFLHKPEYVLAECKFSSQDVDGMISLAKQLLNNQNELDKLLSKQNQLPNRQ